MVRLCQEQFWSNAGFRSSINPLSFTKNRPSDFYSYYEGIIIEFVEYLADRIVFAEKGSIKTVALVSIVLIESLRVGKRAGKLYKQKRYSQVV